jgi:hypothetical protein
MKAYIRKLIALKRNNKPKPFAGNKTIEPKRQYQRPIRFFQKLSTPINDKWTDP